MNLTLIAYATAAALTFGAGFGTAWRWQSGNITQMELEQANERISLQRASRTQAEKRIATQRTAEVKAQGSLRTVSSDRARTDAVGSGLRDTTAAAVRTADSDPSACPERARTLGVVFDQCAQQLIEVAENADRWHIEAVRQHQAAQ